MSTAEILSLISLISFVIAGIAFAFAVFFWFFFKIPMVVGDLSGRTAKKSIARMREHNEQSGGRGYQPSETNVKRGKLTGVMQNSKELAKKPQKAKTGPITQGKAGQSNPVKKTVPVSRPQNDDDGSSATALLGDNGVGSDETALLGGNGVGAEETALLDANGNEQQPDNNETALLNEQVSADQDMPETGLLGGDDGEQKPDLAEATGLLVTEDEETPAEQIPVMPVKRTGGKKLTMLNEVILIHTDEVI